MLETATPYVAAGGPQASSLINHHAGLRQNAAFGIIIIESSGWEVTCKTMSKASGS